jgi:undecaprenyl pyrophosphate phosphatase UppP
MLGRTYQREAALKWLLLMGLPFLFFRTSALWEGIRFQGSGPEEGLSWISFGVGCVVTSVTAAIGVHGWKKSIHQFSFKKLGIYRIIMMILTPLAAWLMSL